MDARLKDKVAIVTGGSRGIGRAVCLAFAKEGAKVLVNAAHAETANRMVQEIEKTGGKALAFGGDVRNKQAMESMVKTAIDNFGKIDILVNNAGIIRDMQICEMTEKAWDDVLDTCLKGTFIVTQLIANWMVLQATKEQNEGKQPPFRKIINVTSGAVRGNAEQANYCSAKAGIIGLTRSNAKELGRYNILVNAISPVGLTEMTRSRKESMEQRAILGRVGDPETDIAPAFVFLASDDANYITGQIIAVNGGLDTQH